MKLSDSLRMVFNSMKYKRLRTVLTIFGILIGPAAIVALLSITQGLTGSITGQLGKIGVTSIFITSTGRVNLTSSDIAELAKLPNVTAVVPYYSFSGNMADNSSESVTVYALNSADLNLIVPSLSTLSGAPPAASSSGAIIGYSVAYPNVTGEPNITTGKVVQVDLSKGGSSSAFSGSSGFGFSGGNSGASQKTMHTFLVTGVYNKFGQGIFISPDTSIFIPMSEGEAISQSSNYTGIFVDAKNASSVTATVSEIEALLGSNVRVTAISSLLSSITSIEGSISTFMIMIAGISFVVAFTGIMTTMFTAVTERTKEIGIMKALGFTSRQIMTLFVMESLIIGLIGGTIGALSGAAISYIGAPLLTSSFGSSGHSTASTASAAAHSTTTHVAVRSSSTAGFASAGAPGGSGTGFAIGGGSSLSSAPVFDPTLIIEVILLTSFMGAVAGLLPAWRAARLIPAEALRAL